jgi:hypothetical protein
LVAVAHPNRCHLRFSLVKMWHGHRYNDMGLNPIDFISEEQLLLEAEKHLDDKILSEVKAMALRSTIALMVTQRSLVALWASLVRAMLLLQLQ